MRHMSINNQRGFTLVEIAVIAPMMILIALAIVAVLVTLVSSTVAPNAKGLLMQQQERAFDAIENDINNSSALISSLPANFSDSVASDYASPPTGTIVLRIQGYDQIQNPNDTTGTKVIPAFKDTAACSNITDLNATNIAPVVVIYFVRNNTLYRRTLIEDVASSTCGTKLAKETGCSSGSCTPDIQLVQGDSIKTFSVTYYTTITGNVTTSDPTAAKSAKITITSTLDAGGDTIEYTANIRAARLNN